MPTLLNTEDVPDELLEAITRSAAANNRPVAAEVVELLRRLVESRNGGPLPQSRPISPPLDPPTVTDEGPPPGDIPLPGPSVRVYPKPGGVLRPQPPSFWDERT